MAGTTLAEQNFTQEIVPSYYSVKEAVFPFAKFPGVDPILGPEMKSTGEVMGVGETFSEAFRKAQLGAGVIMPTKGKAFLSVKDADKVSLIKVAQYLADLGFGITATLGTASMLEDAGFEVERVNKVQEGRPHIVDKIKNNDISFIVNTTEGAKAIADSFEIRRAALQYKVCYTTTIAGGEAFCLAIKSVAPEKGNEHQAAIVEKVRRLQDLHARLL
jgi:carbamoyl-phosphate synthase large subunit